MPALPAPKRTPGVLPAAVAGACASLVGIGLARFAYTPLLPAIIAAGWFSASTAAYLGAANLGGYLAGALGAAALARRAGAMPVLRTMMLLATVSFIACAAPVSFLWFFAWRFAAGIAGGTLMVLAAPTVLAQVPVQRRGLVGGVIFAGVGIGIAASGSLVPLLLRRGLPTVWLALAALSLLLTLLAWHGWPRATAAAPAPAPAAHRPAPAAVPQLRALYAGYGLNAVALVPHMIFLVDYVARGLGEGVDAGAQYWLLYGLGAVAGPLACGSLADRIGFRAALRLAYLLQLAAVTLPLADAGAAGLAVSSVLMGAFTPGIVSLVLGRVNEVLAADANAIRQAWSRATISFALMQAVAAYGLSYLFNASGGSYRVLFVAGAAALLLALLIDLSTPAGHRGGSTAE